MTPILESEIYIVDVENGNCYGSKLHSAIWNKHEKFVGKEWYEYETEKKLKKRDVLGFTFEPS